MPRSNPKRLYAYKRGAVFVMARVFGWNGVVLTQADVSGASYSIVLLDAEDIDAETEVAGHTAVSLDVADVIFDELQADDARWTVDATGYNFAHMLDVSSADAFAIRGRDYRLRYTLATDLGPIAVEFEISTT